MRDLSDRILEALSQSGEDRKHLPVLHLPMLNLQNLLELEKLLYMFLRQPVTLFLFMNVNLYIYLTETNIN